MKGRSIAHWLPFGTYLCLLCGTLAYFWIATSNLIGRMATHFDAMGQPNGWMSAEQYRSGYLLVGVILVPLLTPAFCALIRALNLRINVPNKEYWSHPDRRKIAANFLLRTSFWVSAAAVVFFASLFDSVLRANASQPPHLETWPVLLCAAVLLGAMVAWIIAISVYFSKLPPAPEGWRDQPNSNKLPE